jgi:outer membrane protein assembly factor BamB
MQTKWKTNMTVPTRKLLTLFLLFMLCSVGWGDDWPTHLHDRQRSGHSPEQLTPPLIQQWAVQPDRAPRPAWTEFPAKQDLWQNFYENKPRLTQDNAFGVVIADKRLYYGSSSSDKIVCRDVESGAVLWKFITGGPIRFTPTVYQGRVYVGSDDGYVYCLDGSKGKSIWTFRPDYASAKMMIHMRLCSVCPVRTSVLVDKGVAYWGAGMFSGEQTGLQRYVVACQADTGQVLWQHSPPKPLQGHPLASEQHLFMPAGKSTPVFFNRTDGHLQGDFNTSNTRHGGSYVILSPDNKLFFGPHYSESGSYVGQYNAQTRAEETVAWGPGNRLVVTSSASFYASDAALSKYSRANKKRLWTVASDYPYALILAGDLLFAGGTDSVAAFRASDGKRVWQAPVSGRVFDLAVAAQRLFVSTDQGNIYCFKPAEKKSPTE